MKTYILIHGAWHGSWCFNRYLVPIMSKTHKIYSLDLPGHFHNNDYQFKDITLDTYVNYASDFINDYVDGEVVLVGHSMGGIVISQVAENLGNKISHLVYLCAFVPTANSSLVEQEQKSLFPSVSKKIHMNVEKQSIELSKQYCPELFYNTCSKEDTEFALQHLQDQPLQPFINKVNLKENFFNISKTYIECLNDKAIHIDDQRQMNSICHNIVSLDTDHSPFFSAPEELATILNNI